MWQAITDFLLKAHAEHLSHEAVIEIMVALLGIMVAILALVAFLVSLIFVALAIFGFETISNEVRKIAETIARKTASKIAKDEMKRVFEMVQASGLSESQSQDFGESAADTTIEERAPVKATSDSGLSESGAKL
jgi:ABC-type bacteriocin/lantibiotic exporter with double-glycine peptidase domain